MPCSQCGGCGHLQTGQGYARNCQVPKERHSKLHLSPRGSTPPRRRCRRRHPRRCRSPNSAASPALAARRRRGWPGEKRCGPRRPPHRCSNQRLAWSRRRAQRHFVAVAAVMKPLHPQRATPAAPLLAASLATAAAVVGSPGRAAKDQALQRHRDRPPPAWQLWLVAAPLCQARRRPRGRHRGCQRGCRHNRSLGTSALLRAAVCGRCDHAASHSAHEPEASTASRCQSPRGWTMSPQYRLLWKPVQQIGGKRPEDPSHLHPAQRGSCPIQHPDPGHRTL
mmetsp:Transcript_74063/g.192313  ORF Transcript_74063/g.192313 Transcript_74063/m.192313 type:complete len:280 (-) Transcript_74063:1234-2073(-)